jgi:hypothetical protein
MNRGHGLETREAKARAEPPAAGEQRKLCRPRIGRHPQQRGQLVRLTDHRPQHRRDVRRSIRTQVDKRGRGQRPMRGSMMTRQAANDSASHHSRGKEQYGDCNWARNSPIKRIYLEETRVNW